MNTYIEAGVYASPGRGAKANSVIDILRSVDVSAPSKGTQVPAEVLEIILAYLRPKRDSRPFDPELGQCSLTCRYWAAHIRPRIFSRTRLTSEKMVRALPSLVHSPVVVPAPFRETVRHLEIRMDSVSRPWLYHAWALSRDSVLPNVERISLTVTGKFGDEDLDTEFPKARGKSELLLDIGLPRTVPFTHRLHLHTLDLEFLRFRSYKALLRSLGSLSTSGVLCYRVRWPEESPAVTPAGRIHPPLNLRRLETISVRKCTTVLPMIQGLVTKRQTGPGATQQQLYINETQIDTVVSIFCLFSDKCECGCCKRDGRNETYELKVYNGARPDLFSLNHAHPC